MSQSKQPLVDKYRPTSWNDIQGNNKALRAIKRWAEDFERGDEPQMFAGPAGVGKTSTAQVIAEEMNWPIEEINASDARTTDDIREICERIKLTPVNAPFQLVVLDEADSIPGTTNLNPLKDLLQDSPNPIVIICNEYWEVPSAIKRNSNKHEFKLDAGSRQAKLRKIIAEEDADIPATTIGELAQRQNLRDAIHDLQTLIRGGELMEDGRQYEQSPFEVLDDLIKGKSHELPRQLPDTPDEFIHWIAANVEEEFRGAELQVAWDLLARSDKWLQRAQTEDYRYWKYAGDLQKAVADVKLSGAYDGWRRWDSPNKVWAKTASGNSKEAQLYQELSGSDGRFGLGCGFLEFKEVYLPILKNLDHEDRLQMAVNYGLEGAALEALDLDKDAYEEWRTEEGSKMEETSVFEW